MITGSFAFQPISNQPLEFMTLPINKLTRINRGVLPTLKSFRMSEHEDLNTENKTIKTGQLGEGDVE